MDDRVELSTIFWRSSPPGADALALIAPNPNHPIAPAALREWIAGLTRDGYLENVTSIPFIALAVILLAWRTGWRPPGAAIALAIGSVLLALGPFLRIDGVDTHIPAPWAFLRYLPILRLTRSPARIFMSPCSGSGPLCPGAARWRHHVRPAGLLARCADVCQLWPAPRTSRLSSVDLLDRRDNRGRRRPRTALRRRDARVCQNFVEDAVLPDSARQAVVGGYLSRVSRRLVREQTDPVSGAHPT